MQQPAVSTVICTYNRAWILGRAINSALEQTFANYEIIIVDDGSTDDTSDLVASYNDPRIRYIRLPENRGLAHARNTGVMQARADLIAWLDSDDEWLPEKLERQVEYFARASQPNLGLVFTAREVIDASGTVVRVHKPEFPPGFFDRPFPEIVRRLYVGNFLAPVTVMIRKRTVEAIGGFAEHLSGSDDYDLWLRVAGHYRMGYIPQVLARYRVLDGNMTSNMQQSGVAFRHRVEIAERAVERYPFLKPLRSERVAAWSRSYAHRLIVNAEYRRAAFMCIKAIRHQPRHLPTYLALVLACMGPVGRSAYTRLRSLGGRT
jgi:glycosyltransferase involved in cell wall biosynthesis